MSNTDVKIDSKNTDNKPARAIIISSIRSLGRLIAREFHTHNASHIDCFGFIHPSVILKI